VGLGRSYRCDVIGFPHASLIVEAQAILMKFLRLSIERFLEGISDTDAEGNTKWNEVIRTGLKMNNAVVSWSRFVHENFIAAPRLEFEHILSQARLRSDASSDHLWLLQTEPSYFKRYLRKLSETSVMKALKSSPMRLPVLAVELLADLEMNFCWRAIVVEFEHLRDLFQKHGGEVRPGAPLPRSIHDSLGALEVYLVNTVMHRGRQIQASLVSRPGFEYLYDCVLEPDGCNATFTAKKNIDVSPKSQKMLFLLQQLMEKPDSATRYRYPMILDLLEDHLPTSDRQERGRLDNMLYEKLFDYLVLQELLSAIRMHRSKNRIHELAECRRSEHRLAWNVSTSYLSGNRDSLAILRAKGVHIK